MATKPPTSSYTYPKNSWFHSGSFYENSRNPRQTTNHQPESYCSIIVSCHYPPRQPFRIPRCIQINNLRRAVPDVILRYGSKTGDPQRMDASYQQQTSQSVVQSQILIFDPQKNPRTGEKRLQEQPASLEKQLKIEKLFQSFLVDIPHLI